MSPQVASINSLLFLICPTRNVIALMKNWWQCRKLSAMGTIHNHQISIDNPSILNIDSFYPHLWNDICLNVHKLYVTGVWPNINNNKFIINQIGSRRATWALCCCQKLQGCLAAKTTGLILERMRRWRAFPFDDMEYCHFLTGRIHFH